MALEDLTGTAKFVSALNAAWPVDDDWVDEGDNHIRGIKNVLKNTLPDASGALRLGPAWARFPSGTLAAPGISWIDDPDSGFVHAGAGTFSYSMNAVSAWSVDSTTFEVKRLLKASTIGSMVFEVWKHEITAGVNGGAVLGVGHSGGTPVGLEVFYPNFSARGTSNSYWLCKDATGPVAYLVSNGGLHNFSANNANLSDVEAKQDLSESPDYSAFVENLQYHRFRYKDNLEAGYVDDVVAQEVEAQAPELIGPDWEGTPYKTVYGNRLQQRINSVIPRLLARVKALEEKLLAAG